MKQLAIIATIFLPLSFLTGFFGETAPIWSPTCSRRVGTFWVIGIGTEIVAVAFPLFALQTPRLARRTERLIRKSAHSYLPRLIATNYSAP